jgi:hypothetical protein
LVIPLDKKAVNEVVDPLKADTASIVDPQIKKVFTGLFNLIEVLASENEKLTVEDQPLKNEVNALKGEQGKPDVKPNKRNKKDISSEQERKDDQPGSKDDKDSAKHYLYACGPCNGPKSNHYAIFLATGALIELARKPRDPIVPPPQAVRHLLTPESKTR